MTRYALRLTEIDGRPVDGPALYATRIRRRRARGYVEHLFTVREADGNYRQDVGTYAQRETAERWAEAISGSNRYEVVEVSS